MAARIGITILRQRRQHAVDILEVFVRVPTESHAFDV